MGLIEAIGSSMAGVLEAGWLAKMLADWRQSGDRVEAEWRRS